MRYKGEFELLGKKNSDLNSAEDNSFNNTDLLETLVYLAPYIQQLFSVDCFIGVSDRERFLGFLNGKSIKLPMELTGVPIPEEFPHLNAIKDNTCVNIVTPKGVLGFPFRTTVVPIKNRSGYIVGTIALGISLDNREKLVSLAETVSSSSQEASATVEQLAKSAEHFAKYQETLKQIGDEVNDELNKTTEILNFIRSVAQNSNLLGLNAAIEAARAGEQGRGFSVVADEIRKMAVNSASGVKDIEKILMNIRDKSKLMTDKVMETVANSQEQLAATLEISNLARELASSAEQLEESAKDVIG